MTANCSNLVSWATLETSMVLNVGIAGVEIRPSLEDAAPAHVPPRIHAQINQPVFYFVFVEDGAWAAARGKLVHVGRDPRCVC